MDIGKLYSIMIEDCAESSKEVDVIKIPAIWSVPIERDIYWINN